MAVRDDRSDVKQTTAGFRGPLMVQSLTSAKSKFLSPTLDRLLILSMFLELRQQIPIISTKLQATELE